MYQSKIRKQETGFYSMVVRVDNDGVEQVVFGKWYATEGGAKRACNKFIKKGKSKKQKK